MKRALIFFQVVTPAVLAVASAAAADTTKSAPLRPIARETLSIYRYESAGNAVVLSTPAWSTHAVVDRADEIPAAPDAPVRLKPFYVNESYRNNALHERLRRQVEFDRTRERLGKLGIATHQKQFGKLGFGVVTFLYIPVVVGLSW